MFEYFDDSTTLEVLYGGGLGSAKSYGVCCLMVMKALQFPNIRIGLARNEITTLKRTTVVSLFEVLNNWGLTPEDDYNYNSQSGEITFQNKSKIVLLELTYQPSDPQYTRLGGQLLTFGVIDEAGECNEKGKQIFQSRLGRWKNSEVGIKAMLYMTCNPSKNFLYNHFYLAEKNNELPEYRKFIKALMTDNPYISKEYYDNLLKMLSTSDKERLVGGNWDYDSDPNNLLSYDDINNVFVKGPSNIGEHYISADIAFTSDAAVIMIWKGLDLIEVITNPINLEDEIKAKIKQYNVKSHHLVYDADGVGQYLKQHFPNAKAINNNGKTIDNQNYENLKTQLYFKLTEVIKNNLLSISKDSKFRDKITEELSVIKHKPSDNVGKIAMVSKGEIKRLIGRSPDFSDAMAYRMIFELKPKGFQTQFYKFNLT